VLELLVAAARAVVDRGGTPSVTTGRRTPPAVAEALGAKLPAKAKFFRLALEADDNPYRGLLGLADGFVVTGDSISMMVEIARLGRPLAIFDLPTRPARIQTTAQVGVLQSSSGGPRSGRSRTLPIRDLRGECHCMKRASERMTMMIDGPIRIRSTGGTVNAMVPRASLTGSLLAFSSARSSRFWRISAA
jgi:hypothetical protein